VSFGASVVKDVTGLFATNQVMGQGDLVQIDIGLVGVEDIDLHPSHTLNIKLMPSLGMPTTLKLTAPECIYSTFTSLT
jgi:archaellin